MRHIKTSFAISAIYLAAWITLAALFFSAGDNPVRYFASGLFAVLACYEVFRLKRKIELYNRGHPLTEQQKKKQEQYRGQMHYYQRSNLYNVWYRFADATEQEYLADKVNRVAKRVRHRK